MRLILRLNWLSRLSIWLSNWLLLLLLRLLSLFNQFFLLLYDLVILLLQPCHLVCIALVKHLSRCDSVISQHLKGCLTISGGLGSNLVRRTYSGRSGVLLLLALLHRCSLLCLLLLLLWRHI